MKRKFSKILGVSLALVLVCSFSLVAAVPAGAQDGVPDRETAITRTADRLVALQSTTDYGWDWKVTDLLGHSDQPSRPNLYGVTALGLIDANEVTGNPSYLDKAGLVATHIAVGDPSIGDFWTTYGYGQDYQFLMAYADASNEATYSDYAKAAWTWQKANIANYANAAVWWESAIVGGGGRSAGFVAWQGSACGLAALAMGDTGWASDMAAVMSSHLSDIQSDDIYCFIGCGAALSLFQAVDSTLYATDISALITHLTTNQNDDGSWGTGENAEGHAQDAAYAIIGLVAVGGADAIAAAQDGAAWLVANQGYDAIEGGWDDSTDNIEYSETDSEALQALAATAAPVTIGDDEGYYSIQSAINSASPEATIDVAAGTYEEDLGINKSLTLSGPNAAISPNTGERETEAIIDGDMTVSGAIHGTTIQGFHFVVTPGVKTIDCGGGFDGDDLHILKNSFTADPATTSWTEAIGVHSNNAVAGLVIDDNLVTGVRGIFVNPQVAGSDVTITNNVVVGDPSTPASVGISVDGVSGIISGNVISNTGDAGINVGSAVGPCNGLIISNNPVTNAGNDACPNAGAINLYSDCTNITITGNTLSDSYEGISIKDMGALGSGIAVNLNNITGNSHYGVFNAATSGTLDAEDNWWGTAIKSQIAKLVSGNIDYSPWLDAAYLGGQSTILDVTSISLESGWNLISLPLIPEVSAIETVLAGADVQKVAYYTGGPDGEWLYYSGPPEISDLAEMNDGKGYWVDMNATEELIVEGWELVAVTDPPSVPPSYDLVEGWNLIGFKSLTTDTDVATYLGSAVPTTMERMYGYDAAAGSYTIILDTTKLVPGDGYWLAVSAEGTIYP